LIIFHILIGMYGVYRMKVREVIENPESQFTPLPTTITPIGLELNPATEPIEEPLKSDSNNVNGTKEVTNTLG